MSIDPSPDQKIIYQEVPTPIPDGKCLIDKEQYQIKCRAYDAYKEFYDEWQPKVVRPSDEMGFWGRMIIMCLLTFFIIFSFHAWINSSDIIYVGSWGSIFMLIWGGLCSWGICHNINYAYKWRFPLWQVLSLIFIVPLFGNLVSNVMDHWDYLSQLPITFPIVL